MLYPFVCGILRIFGRQDPVQGQRATTESDTEIEQQGGTPGRRGRCFEEMGEHGEIVVVSPVQESGQCCGQGFVFNMGRLPANGNQWFAEDSCLKDFLFSWSIGNVRRGGGG